MGDHFARELIKIVVVQICQGEGFDSIQASALDTLAEILVKYLEEISYGAHLYAELSCRTDCNFMDLSLALKDVNVSLRELLDYSISTEETPFAKPIPPFPIRSAEIKTVEVDENDAERPEYVPSYLPPFPEKHTYIFTPTYEERSTDPGTIRTLKNKRKRQVELSLSQLSSHVHADAVPKKLESPEYFSYSSSNTFLSHLGNQVPKQSPVQLKVRHTLFADEVNAKDEGVRTSSRIADHEDDAVELKRKKKYENILTAPLQNDPTVI